MGTEQVLDITRQAMKVAILLSAPILVFGLVVGLMTNVMQAVTQISESTLQVIPKILAMLLALFIFSPWMIDIMTDFTTQIFEGIPAAIR